MLTKTVFTGTDELITVTINQKVWNDTTLKYDLVPIPFLTSGAVMTAKFADQEVSSSGDDITFDDDGNVNFKFGMLSGVSKGRAYPVTLNVKDGAHPNGQDLIHPSKEDSNLTIVFK